VPEGDEKARATAELAVLAASSLPLELRDAIERARVAEVAPDEILTALAGAPPGPEADAGRAEDLSDGMVRTAHAFGMRLAVGNAGGAYFAIEATCPHANGPLDLGELHGTTLTCPIHGFEFDVRTGACITDPRCGVKALPVEVRAGHVWVLRPLR
jgi:nitrite reductase/ring-hydroxylating ferredoxin subunit